MWVLCIYEVRLRYVNIDWRRFYFKNVICPTDREMKSKTAIQVKDVELKRPRWFETRSYKLDLWMTMCLGQP